MSRRRALGLGAAAVGTAAAYEILAGPARALAASGAGTRAGLAYFTRFGLTEKLLQDTLAAALGSGGDFADVYCQHQVGNTYLLEDGAVNRAFADVNLGVGVRVVKGDQTGYGFTEDLTPEGLRLAAKTARSRPPAWRAAKWSTVAACPSWAATFPVERLSPRGRIWKCTMACVVRLKPAVLSSGWP